MTLVQQEALALGITAVTTLGLGFFAYLKNPHRRLNQIFGLYSLSIAWWAGWESFADLAAIIKNQASYGFAQRIEFVGVFFIPTLFLGFVRELTGRPSKRFTRWGYLASGVLVMFLPTPLMIKRFEPRYYWPLQAVPGPLYYVGFLFFMAMASHGVVCLLQAYRTSKGIQRNQLKYFLLATVIGYAFGVTDFASTFNMQIPFFNPYGIYGVVIYAVITTYAIVQHRLLDINVVIRKSLVYSVLITLLTAGYFGLIYAIERLFQTTFGYQSLGLSLAAFALMALAFQPLKSWIQRLVDWLIFRVPQEELVKRMERLEEQALQAEKFKVVSTLAAGMAHEIKNPLTALKTFAEFIPEKHQDPNFAKKLHEVFTMETQRIQGIVQEVLDFAKPRLPQLKPVEIGSLIHSTVNLLSADLAKRRVDCTVNCSHNGAVVQADADQLRQVLINLIQNAADAMPNGGTVTLTTRADDGHLELAISDTGKGIPKELLPKIFDPFITTKERGTGLGLAVVYAILQAHHGTIRAESAAGRGATFTLRLPV